MFTGTTTTNERLPIPLPVRFTCKFTWFKFRKKQKLTSDALQDLETFELEDFKYNNVNISAFRIVDADSNVTRQLLRDMEKFQPIGQSILNKTNIIQVISQCIILRFNFNDRGDLGQRLLRVTRCPHVLIN